MALDSDVVDEEEDVASVQQQQPIVASPFYYTNNHNFEGRANGKRAGGRAFNGDDGGADAGMFTMDLWEKRAGGRAFGSGQAAEDNADGF
jgi:hypothetical protein